MASRSPKISWYQPHLFEIQKAVEAQGFILFSKESLERDFPLWGEKPLNAEGKRSRSKLRTYKGLYQFYRFYPNDIIAILSLFPDSLAGPKQDCVVNINVFFSVVPMQRLLCRLQNQPYNPICQKGTPLGMRHEGSNWLLVNPPTESSNNAIVTGIVGSLQTYLFPECDRQAYRDVVLDAYQKGYKINPASAILAYLFQDRFDEGQRLAEQLWEDKLAHFRRTSFNLDEDMKTMDDRHGNPSECLTECFVEKVKQICQTKDLNPDL
jgi:hypothetical protein